MLPRPCGVVTLLSDLGAGDPALGLLRGTILRHSPKLAVVDHGHGLPKHAPGVAAAWLELARRHFPPGAVHVVVLEPRAASPTPALLVAAAHEAFWLAADHGALDALLAADPRAELRQLDLAHLGLPAAAARGDGRAALAAAAGWLAGGRYGFQALGPRRALPALPEGHGPQVLARDARGTWHTDLPAAACGGCRSLRIGGVEVVFSEEVASDLPRACSGAFGLVEIPDPEARLGIAPGTRIELLP
ncbi:MAG: SAM-dependent chlorinase/fluorinase [Planctomycetes bacterium]|nr:SAM-dependent chlorinase/fluorinase [Planctomycetota bacterium]